MSQSDDIILRALRAIQSRVGEALTAEALQRLSADEVTLWGYVILRDEVMDGGFVQLIHNGYGPFFFRNPFARAIEAWGCEKLASLMRRAKRLNEKFGRELTADVSDEEFMALFEKYPQFDDLDDQFVEDEEVFTDIVAAYVEAHPETFTL